jgi:hypothetical protein
MAANPRLTNRTVPTSDIETALNAAKKVYRSC